MNVFPRWRSTRALDAIAHQLSQILGKLDQMAATESDLQADMDAIKALVQKQSDTIAQLGANQATPLISQDQLDALHAEAQAILNPPAAAAPA